MDRYGNVDDAIKRVEQEIRDAITDLGAPVSVDQITAVFDSIRRRFFEETGITLTELLFTVVDGSLRVSVNFEHKK